MYSASTSSSILCISVPAMLWIVMGMQMMVRDCGGTQRKRVHDIELFRSRAQRQGGACRRRRVDATDNDGAYDDDPDSSGSSYGGIGAS